MEQASWRMKAHVAAAALLLLAQPATGAEPDSGTTPAASTVVPTCATAEDRGLDFWIGRWRVETPKGELAGNSHVEVALGGCVQNGLGVHRYDAATQRWRQAWVDETPSTADSIGRQEGERIVYESLAGAGGARRRMTIAPIGDGRVEQRGERWDATAGTWQTTFHLVYQREP